MKSVIALLKETYEEWSKHDAQTMGAALAYFSVLSIAPLLVIAVGVAGLLFGRAAAQGQLVYQIQSLAGAAGAQAIQEILAHESSPASGIAATVVGFVLLLFGAAGVFNELRDALNVIWEVKVESGFKAFLRNELSSFGLVLGIGFLLLVSLAASALLSGLTGEISKVMPVPLVATFNIVLSFVVISAVFAMMYRVVPATAIPWSDVWIGGAATGLMFTVGKSLIGLYLGRASVGSAYGAAGSLIVLLVWVYYSSQIFLFGAEFTHVYATRHGSRKDEPEVRNGQPSPVSYA